LLERFWENVVSLDTVTLIYLVAGVVSATIILILGRTPVIKSTGLLSGYGCSDFRFKPRFPSGAVPDKFVGEWSCCKLGCGGWGCAYLCTRGKEKAVFKVPRGFERIIEESSGVPTLAISKKSMDEIKQKIKHEAEVISTLDHQNIIKLLGYSEDLLFLIYEYADYGTVYWQLSKGWKPSLRDILLIGVQLSDALRYIHSRGLIHGDINPSNIFIKKDGIYKLGDFSSTVKLLSSISRSKIPASISRSEIPGKPGFRAPEQVYPNIMKKAEEGGYEYKIDVYQLANTLLYMLTGESIDGAKAGEEEYKVKKLSAVSNKELREVLAEALKLEPSERPSAEEFKKKLQKILLKVSKT
jgi:serine/threonine protein kinase